MGKIDNQDNTPIETQECLEECKKQFSNLLLTQSNIFRKRRRTRILTDREVRKAFDTLLEGRPPSLLSLVSSNLLKFTGGSAAAYGWHFGEEHTNFSFASWTMIVLGIILFAVGIILRER